MGELELRTAMMAQLTVMSLEQQLGNSPNGEYRIEDLEFGGQTPKEKLLNLVMATLSQKYPDYMWQRTYSLFEKGVTVKWTKILKEIEGKNDA